jgi:hypothetical protein
MVDAVWQLPLDEALASEVRFSPHEQLYLEYRQGLIKDKVPALDKEVRVFHWRLLYQLLSYLSADQQEHFKALEQNQDHDLMPELEFFDSHFHLDKMRSFFRKSLRYLKQGAQSDLKWAGGVVVANYVYPESWGHLNYQVADEPMVYFSRGPS